jgi:uncharacterized protein
MIDLEPRIRAEIAGILAGELDDPAAYIVGSRARGRAKRYADVDLLLVRKRPLTPGQRARLRLAFEESDIPYKIDLIEWADLSPDFRSRLAADRQPLMAGEEAARL